MYFEFDSADLDVRERHKLEQNAACARRARMTGVTVVGMTDPRGTEEYNLALGDRRAQQVTGYMGSLGVSGLRAVSVGEEQASGRDEASWARDRRADITGR